jgi:cytochrome b subunit of formate dehydrogenase
MVAKAAVAAEPAAEAAKPPANDDCLLCHLDASTRKKVGGKEVDLQLFPTNAFAGSVHAKLACIDCHAGVKELIHDPGLPPARCTGCHEGNPTHEAAATNYARSIHGTSRAKGASAAAACADCHGTHDILPVKSPQSPVYKLNLARTCAKCHSNRGVNAEYQMRYPDVASQFNESIHGKALAQGLIVAPSCSDCHTAHSIDRSVERVSSVSHQNVADTCGKCHVGVEQTYNKSIHGQLLAKGDKNGPVCSDCHSAHQIEVPNKGHFKAASDERCGRCHQDRLKHYRDTYHGKAIALGEPNQAQDVAACYDCHGHHDVLPRNNPDSRLSSTHIVQTCRQCHPGANAKFAQFSPHANPLDRANYPYLNTAFILMTGLLVGVFLFFGGHTFLWLFRSIYLFTNDSKTYREARIEIRKGDEWFTRFQPFERFLHFLVVTSFLLLVVTGMPLKFYYAQWAKFIFSIIGGPDVARILHRFGALITFLYFGLHLAKLISSAWRNRRLFSKPRAMFQAMFGPDSMIPTRQDWRDFVAHQKWFFGRGEKPQFDRWTYWEKFDYFSVFWGVFVIGLSGLIMWFPEIATHLLPGWIINIALIVHSDEALLAAGFIFSIHFFNTHFRLEKFPMDTVIFSGRISKAEMLHERKRWYDRLLKEGRLDQFRVKDEWDRWKGIARSLGYSFFGLGVVLLLLIIYAMVSRLFH